MKELDRDSLEMLKDLRSMEQSYLQKLTKNRAMDDPIQLEAIEVLRNKIKQRLAEKTAIGRNLLHELNRFTHQLDTDLAFFETELKTYGYFDVAKKGEIVLNSSTLFDRLTRTSYPPVFLLCLHRPCTPCSL
jgi:ribonucleotide reductase beta subunit family protein with ferritin-like domain